MADGDRSAIGALTMTATGQSRHRNRTGRYGRVFKISPDTAGESMKSFGIVMLMLFCPHFLCLRNRRLQTSYRRSPDEIRSIICNP
jgi:hypothetical protein